MAKKTSARKKTKATPKRAAAKVAAQKPDARRHARSTGRSSPLRAPKEWQSGSIVLGKPPAKSLKGRGAERVLATNVRDADDRPITRTVCDWFVRKLDPSHKISVRGGDYYDAPKVPHLSPEAASLLREKAAVWAQLAERERDAIREREQASLDSLESVVAPIEFQDGRVVLAAPHQPVANAHCWKPDFAGEVYPAVLHYYGYLPAEHVGSITDPNGYPAKAMSPEAAQLYREHRQFWEAKHAESKLRSKAASAVRKKTAEASIEKAAASARLSRADLEAKLDRLASLVEQDNLQLAADMIVGFGDAWLYEALLAGTSIEADGDLKAGKILKRFKKWADLIAVLALAAMPEGLSLDTSLRRDAAMVIEVSAATLDIVAEISSRLPNLKVRWMPRWDFSTPYELLELRLNSAKFLADRMEGGLELSVKNLGVKAALALAEIEGSLELELEALPEEVAASLACHTGALAFPGLVTISQATAAALENHVGRLTLGSHEDFTIDAVVARHLAQHAGPVSLPGVRRLDPQAALLLASQRHGIDLAHIEEFPAGNSGLELCQRLAASPTTTLSFHSLKTVSSECAAALAAFPGELYMRVSTWTDDAIKALAEHRGKLQIDPENISDAVGAALSRRSASTELTIPALFPNGRSHGNPTVLTDGAAQAMRLYEGRLVFEGRVEMSMVAAMHLAERRTLVLQRSKIKPSIRKIFESAGTWEDAVWTRRARSVKAFKQQRGLT